MKTEGKTIVVTGAGSGIGRSITLELLNNGAIVAAMDVNETGLQETVTLANAGDALSSHVGDITDRSFVDSFPQQVIQMHGQVDGLVNNAGIVQAYQLVQVMDNAFLHKILQVNLIGTIDMTLAFLPVLLERPEAHIVNISSLGGFLPVPGQTIYSATKGGVKMFTESLRMELMNTNVGVSVVMPGGTDTNITREAGVNDAMEMLGGAYKLTSPDRVAEKVIRAIEKNRYSIITGNDAKFFHFLHRIAPRFAAKIMAYAMMGMLAQNGKEK